MYAEKRLEVLVDRDLKGCVSAEELEKAVEVALHCTQLTIIKYVTILMKECYLIWILQVRTLYFDFINFIHTYLICYHNSIYFVECVFC